MDFMGQTSLGDVVDMGAPQCAMTRFSSAWPRGRVHVNSLLGNQMAVAVLGISDSSLTAEEAPKAAHP
ncbi:hypothetical protein [Pseudoxanthomonas sacheonensis]|uniref:hypothetical protein n=1 Tax=Pseudoxanthomonas sacheonensis TaxID=443615 RepID=UPI0013D33A7B|nr:hypothetical protein [Pseudoxanthomonas sacheonensis]KAF1708674.1 hypothetical protein CSC73_08240 [Pseudoxanthomonas sacheonensis]